MCPSQRGVALIVVLWAVALISAAMLGLAAILQRQLAQEVAALQNSRATLVAESGLQMALNPAIQPSMAQEASRVLSGELQQGWGGVEVQFEVKAEDLRGGRPNQPQRLGDGGSGVLSTSSDQFAGGLGCESHQLLGFYRWPARLCGSG